MSQQTNKQSAQDTQNITPQMYQQQLNLLCNAIAQYEMQKSNLKPSLRNIFDTHARNARTSFPSLNTPNENANSTDKKDDNPTGVKK